jgi:hypothetical protein
MTLTFKARQRKLTDDEQHLAESIKQKADDLYAMMDLIHPSSEQRSAKMRLEESVMWAIKAISISE